MEIAVSVTQEHIDKGQRTDACTCAVALAIIDAIKKQGVAVTFGSVFRYINFVDDTDNLQKSLRVPDDVYKWIRTYDDLGAESVKPIEFTFNTEYASAT